LPERTTLLAVFAHPDDELGVAGTLLAHRARGDRVVILYLTRGEATGAFGDLPEARVKARREAQAAGAAELLDVEHRFLDFPDCGLVATPEAARAVARVIAELRPDGLVTWGDAWVKGMRHPDHQATGKIARDAITYARIPGLTHPLAPHRAFCPVFTMRGVHATLPLLTVDVTRWAERIFALADYHRALIGFGERGWLEARLRAAGQAGGVELGEAFEAWETHPGTVECLLPATEILGHAHPTRAGTVP
jgi:LmbE family N-acetylglucosaminyl deacetylase